MANFNSGKIYNKKLPEGGATYNSAPFLILILDNIFFQDEVQSVLSSTSIIDIIKIEDDIFITNTVNTEDSLSISDSIDSILTIINIEDTANIQDFVDSVSNNVSIQDIAWINDIVSAPAVAFFTVDSNNILQPLGVHVTRDSRYELLPSTRDISEEVTGIHGELDFSTEFKARTLELTVAALSPPNCEEPFDREKLKRLYAKYLDPTKGYRNLVFADDIDKTYQVKFSGKIDFTQFPDWFQFTIPFKMANPFIIGSIEKSHSGNGTITNEGTFETGMIIEIVGPVSNPTVAIGGDILTYNGSLSNGQVLTIDTEKKTVKIGNNNAVGDYNGIFPLLAPGETSVTAGSNVSIKWRDKWL